MAFRTAFMPAPRMGNAPASYVPAERVRPAIPDLTVIPRFLTPASARYKKTRADECRIAELTRKLDDIKKRYGDACAEAAASEARTALWSVRFAEVNSSIVISFREIIEVVSGVSGVPLADLYSARRMKEIVRPRQVVFWLCRRFTRRSLPVIGRYTGGRDHTTVLHGVRRVDVVAATLKPERDDPEAWTRALLTATWPPLLNKGRGGT